METVEEVKRKSKEKENRYGKRLGLSSSFVVRSCDWKKGMLFALNEDCFPIRQRRGGWGQALTG